MQIDNLGVIGAGMMGAEIALIFAMSGKSVMLNDTSQDRLDEALNNLLATLDAGISRNFWTEGDKAITLSNIALTTNLEDFSECYMVIEAVFEDIGVKQTLFQKLFLYNTRGLLLRLDLSEKLTPDILSSEELLLYFLTLLNLEILWLNF